MQKAQTSPKFQFHIFNILVYHHHQNEFTSYTSGMFLLSVSNPSSQNVSIKLSLYTFNMKNILKGLSKDFTL